MTVGAGGWSAFPDRGLDRVLNVSRSAVRTRAVRRRLFLLLLVVGPSGALVALISRWPDTALTPLVRLPAAVSLVGVGLAVLTLVLLLVGCGTMARAGSNPFSNLDPLHTLARADRAWVRARIAACAPVAPEQHELVTAAAEWMAREPGSAPQRVGLVTLGASIALTNPAIVNLVVALVLVVEGPVLIGVVSSRARTARRWLSLYA